MLFELYGRLLNSGDATGEDKKGTRLRKGIVESTVLVSGGFDFDLTAGE